MRVAGPLRRTPALILATSALAGATAGPAMATNGLNSLGFGLEALAMAGADVAVARDPLALNTNPAGLAQVRGTQVEAQGALVHELGIEHSDQFNPPTDIQNDYFRSAILPCRNVSTGSR